MRVFSLHPHGHIFSDPEVLQLRALLRGVLQVLGAGHRPRLPHIPQRPRALWPVRPIVPDHRPDLRAGEVVSAARLEGPQVCPYVDRVLALR